MWEGRRGTASAVALTEEKLTVSSPSGNKSLRTTDPKGFDRLGYRMPWHWAYTLAMWYHVERRNAQLGKLVVVSWEMEKGRREGSLEAMLGVMSALCLCSCALGGGENRKVLRFSLSPAARLLASPPVKFTSALLTIWSSELSRCGWVRLWG